MTESGNSPNEVVGSVFGNYKEVTISSSSTDNLACTATIDISDATYFTFNCYSFMSALPLAPSGMYNSVIFNEFTGVPEDSGAYFYLIFSYGSFVPKGITWPGNVMWADGTPPTLSAGVDVLFFITPNGGSSWFGKLLISNAYT